MRYLTNDIQHIFAKPPRLLRRHLIGIIFHYYSLNFGPKIIILQQIIIINAFFLLNSCNIFLFPIL